MKRILSLAICCLLFLSGCSSKNASEEKPAAKEEEPQENLAEIGSDQKQNEGQLLLDDDYVKVCYLEVFEEQSIDGAFYFRLQVENKTEKTVTIYLLDPSVNNVSTLALAGVPMTIRPGRKSLTPFFFSYSNLDISSLDELEEISFKVKVEDNETLKEIETSDIISISSF